MVVAIHLFISYVHPIGPAPSSELTCNISKTNASIYLPSINLLACFRWAMIYRPNTHPFTYTPWYITVPFLLTLTKMTDNFSWIRNKWSCYHIYMIKLVSLCISIQCWTDVLYFNCEHKFNPLFTESVVVDKTLKWLKFNKTAAKYIVLWQFSIASANSIAA